ncbi:MAG: DUF6179 domain-containing protein [Erysipelotrichaceae bacterium]|nr:DUF6179 domain-containing protein [Erysipelotrichaceae bacterium]
MKTIAIIPTIKEELLRPNEYFLSFMEQLPQQNQIQTELLFILAKQADRYSQGKSSSIPLDKAEEIMESILFVLGVQLKSYPTTTQALAQLQEEPLESLYKSGLQLIQKKITSLKRFQKQLIRNLLDTPNIYYRSTIIDGINGFFQLYQPQFTAQKIHITADYPILIGRPQLDGIEFIEQYLQAIAAENAFCIRFSSKAIHHLLCGLTPEYTQIPLNLLEPVLLSAIGLTLVHQSCATLNLTNDQLIQLQQFFLPQSKEEILQSLNEALLVVKRAMNIPQSAIGYAQSCLPKLAKSIHTAVSMNTLNQLFLIPSIPETKVEIMFSYEDRMDNQSYQQLLENILQADTIEEKLSLIFHQISSIPDLFDLILEAEFTSSELESIVSVLPDPVRIALLSQYPNGGYFLQENEQLLYQALQKERSHHES